MRKNVLVDLSKEFAIDTIRLCEKLSENRKWIVLINQFLRSGTSIGANIREANYGASSADFINKMQIALKECYESEYWLELLKETEIIGDMPYDSIHQKCGKIRMILIATIRTVKSRNGI